MEPPGRGKDGDERPEPECARARQILGANGSPFFYRGWRLVTRHFTPLAVGILILFMIDQHLGIVEGILGRR